jgi:hypothetical protein
MKPVAHRLEVLDELKGIVCKDRMADYSDAEDNFAHIAGRWSLYLNQRFGINVKVANFDVAAMMMDVKISRIAASPLHRDSWIDTAGYGVCGTGIIDKLRADTKPEPPKDQLNVGPIKPPVGWEPNIVEKNYPAYEQSIAEYEERKGQ